MILLDRLSPKVIIILWLGPSRFYSGFFLKILWISDWDFKFGMCIHKFTLDMYLCSVSISTGYQIGKPDSEDEE